jgi:hypothetical protein
MPGILNVYALPTLAEPADLAGGTAVVVDVLRATTDRHRPWKLLQPRFPEVWIAMSMVNCQDNHFSILEGIANYVRKCTHERLADVSVR